MPAVLIVDDDMDHRELLELTLTRNGYEVVQASDGASARAVLAARPIDAALFDVRLPGESGIELCADLRRHPGTENLPIMLVSAEAHDERLADALAAGADDYLLKPFHRSELVVRLDALVSRGRIGASLAARLAMRATAPLLRAGGVLAERAPARYRIA